MLLRDNGDLYSSKQFILRNFASTCSLSASLLESFLFFFFSSLFPPPKFYYDVYVVQCKVPSKRLCVSASFENQWADFDAVSAILKQLFSSKM